MEYIGIYFWPVLHVKEMTWIDFLLQIQAFLAGVPYIVIGYR
jgi:hypothetical protein